MKRKVRIALGINIDEKKKYGCHIEDNMSWGLMKKRHLWHRATPFHLIRIGLIWPSDPEYYYIINLTYRFPITPYFWIKEVFYEEKN